MTSSPSWPLLEQLPAVDRDAVLATAVRRSYRAGEQLFGQEDPADAVHLLVAGRVAVSRRTPDGDVTTFAVLGPGEHLGELALVLPGRRRTADAVALEPTVTLALPATRFDALRGRHPGVERVLVGLLAAQVERLSAHLLEALHVPADQRVLRRLAHLTRHDPLVALTQEQLAGLSGTARPTVNRVLRRAQRDGLLLLGRGTVRVLDRPALLASCGRGG